MASSSKSSPRPVLNSKKPIPTPTITVSANIEEDNAPRTSGYAVVEPIQKRNMSGKVQVFTDLFKLNVSTVIKHEGWDAENEHPKTHASKFSHWEHTHPFRTFDKKGSRMNTCTPIGGHFHVIEWEAVEGGVPRIKSCSGPMVMGKERVRGQVISKPVPANDYDDHTHVVEYLRSAEIEFSTTNIEATKIVAMEAAKTAPLAGVEVR